MISTWDLKMLTDAECRKVLESIEAVAFPMRNEHPGETLRSVQAAIHAGLAEVWAREQGDEFDNVVPFPVAI